MGLDKFQNSSTEKTVEKNRAREAMGKKRASAFHYSGLAFNCKTLSVKC